jgi:hypothetical protein
LKAETGFYNVTGHPVALILVGTDRIEVNDFSGTSTMTLQPDGSLSVQINGRVRRGTSNEDSVLKVLRSAVEVAVGEPVELMAGEDARGEDGKLRFGGRTYVAQIVTVPSDRNIGKEIASGKFEIRLTEELAVAWISGSIEHKTSIASMDRPRTILALDVRHVGMLCEPSIVEEMLREKPHITQLGFAQIWLVGPVSSRCVRVV